MKSRTLAGLAFVVALCASSPLIAQLPVAVIVFNPSNDPGQNARVQYAVDQMQYQGNTGNAIRNWALDAGTYVYVTINSNLSASTYVAPNGATYINLNDDPSRRFLNQTDFDRAQRQGEVPPNESIALGHEMGHGIVNQNHPSGSGYNQLVRESDVISNYENQMRAYGGHSTRTTYAGNPLVTNQSLWQTFANWIVATFIE